MPSLAALTLLPWWLLLPVPVLPMALMPAPNPPNPKPEGPALLPNAAAPGCTWLPALPPLPGPTGCVCCCVGVGVGKAKFAGS